MGTDRALRVLIDGYWWESGAPSGRNVVRSLVRTWSVEHSEDRLTVAVPQRELAGIEDEFRRRDVPVSLIGYPRTARWGALAAKSLGRRSQGFDAVLTQNFAARCRHATSCVLVHDAMWVDHPEWFSIPERAYLSAVRPSLRNASIIFTTSQSETARVGRVWPETRSRLTPVGLGVPLGLLEAAPRRPDSLGGDEPFILVVGRLNIRKNLRRLLDAFVHDPRLAETYRLIVVGEPEGKLDPAATSSSAANVSFLDHVDDGQLRWLYERCALFVFPSLDEGFGLPLIEAQAFGARAIASDIPAFREAGGAEVYFDPRSTEGMARGLLAALGAQPIEPMPEALGWSDVVGRIREAMLVRLSAS